MMQDWFKEAKLGIMLHWGIYSVYGIAESWAFQRGDISYEDYMKQCDGFTAENYDPDQWAELFSKAGARYAILTAKHHDGVALFDTAHSDLNVLEKTPAKRDLVGPYCKAIRKKNMKVGLYFSHLDWSQPDYPSILQPNHDDQSEKRMGYAHDKNDFEAWQRFLNFHRSQLKELSTQYGTIDLFWFDGDWQRSAELWRMAELREELHSYNPNVILNSRMLGYGDYQTPEQGIPVSKPKGPWEFCMTMNDSWGYQTHDHNHKSVRQIVRYFAETIGMGGNLLLGVGPRADGSITPNQEETLLQLGDWINKHEEAIYPTEAGLPEGLFFGASTLSKDRRALYLFVFDRPWDSIAIKGIINPVKKATVVGKDQSLSFKVVGGAIWMNVPGMLWVDIPEDVLDQNATIIRLDFDEPLELYLGSGHEIQQN